MNRHTNIIPFRKPKNQKPSPEEVKRVLTETEDDNFNFGNPDNILSKKTFVTSPLYVRPLAFVFLLLVLASCIFIFLGWVFFENKWHWIISACIGIWVICNARYVINWLKQKRKLFCIAVTPDTILCIVCPQHYIENFNVHEFTRKKSVDELLDLGQLIRDAKQAEKEAEERSLQNIENNSEFFHISRYANISSSKHYITLTHQKRIVTLPYNKSALEFLNQIVLIDS